MICIKDFSFLNHIFDAHLRDLSDTLNCIITPGILLILCSIVSFKSYVVSPIHCFLSSAPKINGFDKYVEAYCWVYGTVDLDKYSPVGDSEWKSFQRIGYYQWIPFILFLQGGFYYLPNLIWKAACHHNHGTDLSNIIQKSIELANDTTNIEKSTQIISCLEEIFFVHRDFRQDCISKLKRKVFKICKFLIISKRLATKLSMNYIFVKLLYFGNGISQIFLIKTFLGIDNWFSESYGKIFRIIFYGDDWTVSKYFPRVSFCDVRGIRMLGINNNVYTAQCILPVNMFNEKIFLFLFLWYTFVLLITFLSLISWFYQLGNRRCQISLIKKYLKMRQNYKKVDILLIERFVQQFLRIDGIFLLNMIRHCAGDVVTSGITNGLYKTYFQKYRHQKFNNDKTCEEIESLSLKLERGGRSIVKMCLNKPTAPDNKEYLL